MLDVTAQALALFQSRQLLIADGGVAVKDGVRTMTSSHAVVYLREGRLVLTGGVTVKDGATTTQSASYQLDLTSDKGTASAQNDAFGGTESVGVQPDATSQHATIQANVSVTLTPATSYVGGSAQSVATFSIPLVPAHARDFGPSPAYGAALELPVRLEQSSDWFTFGRARYDRYLGGLGAGLETHYAASDRGYAAFAATQDGYGARYDVTAFQTVRPGLTQTFNASRGVGLQYGRYALVSFGARGTAQASTTFAGSTRSDDLYASTTRRSVARIGFVRLEGDLGHDLHPADYAVTNDTRATLGLAFDSEAIHIAQASLSFQAYASGTGYNYGRGRFFTNYASWVTRQFGPRLLVSGGYGVAQTNDTVGTYPRATLRTATIAQSYQSRGPWSIFTSIQYNRDFPQFHAYGRPLFFQTVALRIKRKHGPAVEINGSFGYGGLGSAPRPTLGLRFLSL